MDFWVIFLTGLTVGGLTCLAVQGGLLASTIAARAEEGLSKEGRSSDAFFAIAVFLVTKLVAYTLLGFLLGFVGKSIFASDGLRIFFQLFAGVYMILIALNLLNVHPLFRYAVITPPRFFTRMIRKEAKSKDLFAPAILGGMTVFIPCGTTLAMEALAISTGNPFNGALVMFFFILGTTPLFFILGFLTNSFSGQFKTKFLKLAALAIIYLGILSIDGSLVLLNSPITLKTLAENSPIQIGEVAESTQVGGELVDGVQVFNIKVDTNGYTPNYLKVKQGEKVRINLETKGVYTCASAFRIPSLGIAKDLKPTGVESVEFVPNRKGRITFACSMGMYSGVIEVI